MCSFARASVPHTSNLTASITGGGRFVRMVENTDFFSTDKHNRETGWEIKKSLPLWMTINMGILMRTVDDGAVRFHTSYCTHIYVC